MCLSLQGNLYVFIVGHSEGTVPRSVFSIEISHAFNLSSIYLLYNVPNNCKGGNFYGSEIQT